jgi:hypothetical protein
MKISSAMIAFVIPVFVACGHPPPTGSGGAGGSGGQPPAAQFESFEYRLGYGPCPPGKFCTESISADELGTLEREYDGAKRTASLSVEDLRELADFATSDALSSALADPTPCSPPITDIAELLTVTLKERAPVEKYITRCTAEPYASVQEWLGRLRLYF